MTRLAKPKGAAAPATPAVFPAIPPADVLGRLTALKTAPAAELQAQWRELFGKEAPPHNRAYLQSRLAYQIQAAAYGGLKPETLRASRRSASNWMAETSRCAASASTTSRSPARGWCGTTRASTTR